MNKIRKFTPVFTYAIAAVWLYFGLYCKVLNQQPHHREIVARMFGVEVAPAITTLIGLAEVGMAVWVITKFRHRLCALTQIVVVASMNILEFIRARDLLVFTQWNAVIAFGFILLVAFHGFILLRNHSSKSTR